MSAHLDVTVAARTAVITGGGGGIGSATAIALGRAGVRVHVVDLHQKEADDAADRVRAAGGSAQGHAADITSEDEVVQFFENLDAAGETCDLLVNAAGVITYVPLEQMAGEDLTRLIEVNLVGTFLCLREAAMRMRRIGGGRVVNLASTASFVAPRLSATAYSMTKGGVRQLTTAAAAELAAAGILVNAVAPGTTRTDFLQGSLEGNGERTAAGSIPLGRVAEPEDVVGAIMFFASELSSYVTGQTLLVDGGRTTRSS